MINDVTHELITEHTGVSSGSSGRGAMSSGFVGISRNRKTASDFGDYHTHTPNVEWVVLESTPLIEKRLLDRR